MSPRRLRSTRGQAVVETVLGLLVFVSLLTFALFLSESIYASMKVQEASASALWDSTAGKMHDWPVIASVVGLTGGIAPASSTVSAAQANAQSRYADLDGRTNINGSTPMTQVFAQTSNVSVNCSVGSGPSYPGRFSLSYWATRLVYEDNGGITCGSSADLTAFHFPTSFLDSGPNATFKVKNLQTSGSLQLCGVGRPIGGSCQAKYKMMIDDWGLAGSGESGICFMIPDMLAVPFGYPCLPNMRYWAMTRLLYEESTLTAFVPTGTASALATFMVGSSPIDEDRFWMSFQGENPTMFLQPIIPQDTTMVFAWPTNPGGASILMPWYFSSYGGRKPCFLGQVCN